MSEPRDPADNLRPARPSERQERAQQTTRRELCRRAQARLREQGKLANLESIERAVGAFLRELVEAVADGEDVDIYRFARLVRGEGRVRIRFTPGEWMQARVAGVEPRWAR